MKKILSIACVALAVATLASCKKTYVTNVVPNVSWTTDSPITPSQWVQTADGKSDSVDIAVKSSAGFFRSSTDATLVYFSYLQDVWEQVPEVYNGVAYSYFYYTSNSGNLHLVLYAQPTNGGAPVKPTSNINAKVVLIPAE